MCPSIFRRIVCMITVSFLFTGVSLQVNAQTVNSKFTVDDLLEVTNINVADLSDDGQWLAATTATLRDRIGIDNSRFGDPSYFALSVSDLWVIETRTGKKQRLFSNKRQVLGLKWSPGSDRLALLVRKGDLMEPMIWERTSGKLTTIVLPAGMQAANNTTFQWSADGSQATFMLWKDSVQQKAASSFKYETKGPVVVHSSKEPFLAWDALRRTTSFRSIVSYDVKTGKLKELLPETKLTSFRMVGEGSTFIYAEDISKKTDYDVIFGVDNQVYVMNIANKERRVIIKSTKGLTIFWSEDNNRYAYAKDGNVFVASIDDKEMRQLTGKKTDTVKTNVVSDKPKNDTTVNGGNEKKENEKFSIVSLSPKGDWLVVSNKEGMWLMNAVTGEKEIFIKISEEDKEAPTYQVVSWTAGADHVYFSYSSRTKWERGIVRYNVRSKKLEDVVKNSRLYADFRLSKDGSTFIYTSSESNRPADLYVADVDFKEVRLLTETNPQLKTKSLSKTELISYLDVDGNKMYGVLYYPTDYEPGKKYPTIFNLYEKFFDDNFSGTMNILTSNGYAVMQPSVNLEIGFPGEAWMKGVTSAANKLIEMGIADPERLGVQGTSYGGYATNLLITQTNRFKAAINISGKVNMISFYTGSPRLGVRNIHAPEKSQDRIGATLWQQPQKYIQHSAIMFADRIKTPLLLMSGEQDHNVPATQAMEMYFALRRLDKEVEWVSYINGGHGMPTNTIEEIRDYHKRIIDWYDSHLKGDLKKKAEEKKGLASAQD